MLNNLNDKQKKLAIFMSELSEEAYTAGWMNNLEYHLWQIMNREISDYGRLKSTEGIIKKLETLSNEIGGWIYFDDVDEETFINLNDWNDKLENF